MRKRRTREHVISDLSVNYVERVVLRCGWTVERMRHDYGIDLMMRTYNEKGEAETAAVYMQIKATDRPTRSSDGKTLPIRLEWRDLLFWLNEPMPVILVLYDASVDRAWWLDIQDYFRSQAWGKRAGSTTVTVHIPMSRRLNEAAIRRIGRIQRDLAAGGKDE
jgi:hypothetical protein